MLRLSPGQCVGMGRRFGYLHEMGFILEFFFVFNFSLASRLINPFQAPSFLRFFLFFKKNFPTLVTRFTLGVI